VSVAEPATLDAAVSRPGKTFPAARGAPERTFLVVGLAVSAFFVSWGALHYGFYTHRLLQDTPLYERYGDAIAAGRVPYRDFSVEYPPLALPVFAIPSALGPSGNFALYSALFEALMVLCGLALVTSVAIVAAKKHASVLATGAPIALVGFGALALGPVVLSRFDLWPTALTAAALAAFLTSRRGLAFGLLALGFVAKIYPAVLLPPLLIYVWRRDGRRSALRSLGIFVGVSLCAVLPFLVVAPHGLWASVSEQASRPLQIESLGASLLLAGHQVSGLVLNVEAGHGSDNLGGSLAHSVAVGQAALQLFAIVFLWITFARGRPTSDRLLRTCAACICAFIVFGKVLSPQYLVWLLPVVALVRGRRGLVAGGLLVAAMALTQAWFPYRYVDLVYALDPVASWLVVARDLVLVALLVVLAWPESARGSRPSRVSRLRSLASGRDAATLTV
jgi:hypothetical protein